MLRIKNTAGGTAYHNPLVSPSIAPVNLKIDVSLLTTAEVDAFGYLKPGVVFGKDGTPIGASEPVWGVVVEATQIVDANPTNVTLAADTSDPIIGVVTMGIINRDLAEDNLGRAYTANELAGFDLAGSSLRVTTT